MKMDKVLETLKEDYQLRASLKRKHLKVQDELEDEIEDLEQSLITSKIIPELMDYAKTLLKDFECEVLLSIKKDINGDIVVCDEYNFGPKVMSNQPINNSTQTPNAPGYILITSSNIQDVQGRDMRITVDGKEFEEKNAIQTFIKALEYIGLDKVASVGIICSGYNLVDNRQRLDGGKKWQQQVGNKWVYVYYSNTAKVMFLMQIAEKLNLKIKIEAIY